GAPPIGARLDCSTPVEAETVTYLWLRNGTPIPGAESPTYTTAAADEGKAIQCQATAKDALGGASQTTNPAYVAPPAPAIAPPGAPRRGIPRPQAYARVGGPPESLLCRTETWQGAESFAYQWYRSGEKIVGATSATYLPTVQDLSSPGAFQCAITAS